MWRLLDYRYIYILGSSRYLFRYKIGISTSVKRRSKNINDSLRGEVYEIFAAQFFFAEKIELMMHVIYRPLGAKMYGTGRTEWFWMLLPVTPTVLLLFFWLLQWIIFPAIFVGGYFLYHHWGEMF